MIRRILILAILGLVIATGIFLIQLQLGKVSLNNDRGEVEVAKKQEKGKERVAERPLADRIYYKVAPISSSDELLVEEIGLLMPGYVAVFSEKDEKLGEVLGSSILLPLGISQGVKIKLKRNLVKGESVYIGLHTDDGDSVFVYPSLDIPIHAKGLVPIRRKFPVRQ